MASQKFPSTGTLERWARVALLGLFLLALAGGIALLVRQGRPQGVEVLLPSPTVQVYLTGAVEHPGVYTFPEEERLADALVAAGGSTSNADLAQVNLALRLQDQDHFGIPHRGEEAFLPSRLVRPDGSPRLDLNAATVEELDALPGIGEVRAEAIVKFREEEGLFETVQELAKVRGIGAAVLEGLRELVTVE